MRIAAVVVVMVGCSSSAVPPQLRVESIAVQQVEAAHARARAPVPAWTMTASDGTGLELTTVDARAVIEGPLALTELHLHFHNPENRVREGTFTITLPPRAAISRFAMVERDQVKEAEVVEKALARAAYDDFLQRRVDPALLETAPGNQFTARVFPIPANGEKELVLAYSQELVGEGYTLPLRGLPRIAKVDVELSVVGSDGKSQLQTLSERGWQPDRDFVASTSSTTAVADGALVAGVFEVAPALAARDRTDRPTSLTVLVDTSASRALGFARYLDAVAELVRSLEGVHVDVIAFDQGTVPVYSGPGAGFGDAQVTQLEIRGPGGASDFGVAASVAKGRTLIVTDGVETSGRADLPKMFAHADRVDVVVAGGIREERTAHALARAGKRAGDVFDLDRDGGIAAALGETVRVDVPVEVAHAVWSYPRVLPTAREGKLVMVYARLAAPAKSFDVQIGATHYTAKVTAATPALLQRAAARAEIEALETQALATSDDATKLALRAQIAKKSVAARVVSSETTMLVLDSEADYATYGISRKALAEILIVKDGKLAQVKRTFFALHVTRGSAGHFKLQPLGIERLTREQAIELARNAGVFGSVRGGLSSLASTGDVRAGFAGVPGEGRGAFNTVGSGRAVRRHIAAAAPTIVMAAPVVSGSLDQSMIRRYVRRHRERISYCYERELLARPHLEGTVATRFTIVRGKVQHVEASGVDEAVSRCIAEVIRNIEFPAADEGRVEINYPFHFRVSGREPQPEAIAAAPVIATPAPAAVDNAPALEPLGIAPIDALAGKLATVLRAIAQHDLPAALVTAKRWRDEQPGDMLAWVGLGEAFEAMGDRTNAARAYGAIIDLFGARAEYRRFAGERLERVGATALASETYRRAVADRPEQLTGHRLYAYALVRQNELAAAFAAILRGVDTAPAGNRYAGAPHVLAGDAGMIGAAYIAARPEQRAAVLAELTKRSIALATRPSTRFVLYWETDANDVDLHVRDRHGNEASYMRKDMPSGGTLFADVTTGFGPECFEIAGTPTAGPYELSVHYYAQGPMGYGMGTLQVQRFDGKAFTFEDRPYVIMQDGAQIALGKIR